MRILVIEDERKLAEALCEILSKNKYAVDMALDGEFGLDCARSGIYDLILLDLMLPKLDGKKLLETVRREGISTPVIIISAKGLLSDRIEGLDLGGDDYITKPFSADELLARIRAILRREHAKDGISNSIFFKDLELCTSSYELSCKSTDKRLMLSAKEFQIMEILMRTGAAFTKKDDLLLKVWGYDSDAEYGNLEVYISMLRKKLTHIGARAMIRTVRGIGYRIEYDQKSSES